MQRILPAVRTVAAVSRWNGLGLQASRPMSTPANWKPKIQVATETRSTMSDIPVPEGPWQEHYNKTNSRWNMCLAGAAVFFAITFAATFKFGVWLLHDIPDIKKVKIDPN